MKRSVFIQNNFKNLLAFEKQSHESEFGLYRIRNLTFRARQSNLLLFSNVPYIRIPLIFFDNMKIESEKVFIKVYLIVLVFYMVFTQYVSGLGLYRNKVYTFYWI